ncbi:MAG: hypothetical protein ACFE9R_18505, partial [Candidatus Hermodarchaeota archaeon]
MKLRIKSSLKMKKLKIFIVLIILIWCFSPKLQNTTFIFDEQYAKDNQNILIHSSASSSETVQWMRLWAKSGDMAGLGVAIDSSDNVYTIGKSGHLFMDDNIHKIFLVKYDSSGVQQWNYTWVSPLWGDAALAVDSTDNVYLAGNLPENIILVKFDSSGVQLWNRTIYKYNGRLGVDSSDNVYIAGTVDTQKGFKIYLEKYDSFGIKQWNLTWGSDYVDSECNGVAIDSSDNVYLTGRRITSPVFNINMLLVKFNSSGAELWSRTWGGSERESADGIAVDSFDNVYLAGYTESFGSHDVVLVKYHSSGVLQWFRTWGGSERDWASGVAIDSSGVLYLVGGTESFGVQGHPKMVLLKYNSSGSFQWYRILTGDEANGVSVDSSDNVYISGEILWGRTVTVKFVVSNITINFPSQFSFYGSITPTFDISTFDSNLDSTWYTLDGGIVNITFSGSTGVINQAEWDKQKDGVVDIRFFMNNTMGKEEYVEVSVIKDTYSPKVTIISPLQNEKFGSKPPSYKFSIVEPNFELFWIELNGESIFMFGAIPEDLSEVSGTLSQYFWDRLPQGEINVTFYAKDFTGKIGTASVVVIKSIP